MNHTIYVASEITPAQTTKHVNRHFWVCECEERGPILTDSRVARDEGLKHQRMALRRLLVKP